MQGLWFSGKKTQKVHRERLPYAKPKVRRPYIYFASTIVTAFCFSAAAAAAAAAAVVACSTRWRSCATAA